MEHMEFWEDLILHLINPGFSMTGLLPFHDWLDIDLSDHLMLPGWWRGTGCTSIPGRATVAWHNRGRWLAGRETFENLELLRCFIAFHCQVWMYYPLERKDATLETALFWLALPSTKESRCLAAHLPDCWGVLSKPLKIGWSKSWLNRCQKKLEIKFQTPWHQIPQEILLNKSTQCILDSKML